VRSRLTLIIQLYTVRRIIQKSSIIYSLPRLIEIVVLTTATLAHRPPTAYRQDGRIILLLITDLVVHKVARLIDNLLNDVFDKRTLKYVCMSTSSI